jgi:hypothetical protein
MPTSIEPTPDGQLSEEDRRIVWEQFVEVYAHAQETYDSSIRTLASAGIGVTVSIGTALHAFPGRGVAAVLTFIGSLISNLVSYGTAQLDMGARLECLRHRQYAGIEGNRWTTTTKVLNLIAGATFVAGAALLAAFVASAT